MKYEELINEVEALFEQNKAKDAEQLLLNCLEQAKNENDPASELQILNELIGYYRQTSEKEQLIRVMERSIEVAEGMGLLLTEQGRIPYATTVLNVANGYRSIGELDKSEELYHKVLDIYLETLGDRDMLLAGLYNNMSLLFQEKGDFEGAMDYQLKALDIVTMNDAGFEIAVTFANMANTAILAASVLQDEKFNLLAKEYATEAIVRFEERGTIDPHYCAAINALGLSLYRSGDFKQAYDLFQKGMDIVKSAVGENSQYMRLKESRDLCAQKLDLAKDEGLKTMKGLELSKLYYEQCGKPMLEEQFGEYISKIAVGLAGGGSDCFGYDDEASADHDWGPDFCLWVSDETYELIGDKLKDAYEALPDEFMGYRRNVTKRGAGRRGVIRISDFYKNIIGTDVYENINWAELPDYAPATAVNGEVFADEEGIFTEMRSKLATGYPENILYLKLADDLAVISQTGQYNYERMLKRGDRITADLMLGKCISQIMILGHHMTNQYPPHDKWLSKSFENIMKGTELTTLVKRLHSSYRAGDEDALQIVTETLNRISEFIAGNLYAMNYISDIETYLDYHTDELVRKASYAEHTDEELVDIIARTEFKAFDKVQNEGGRASCQNNWPTFSVMRKSQYLTWSRPMLLQYLYDFNRELELGHNLITEKYGRMMESTAPEKYKEIAENFPELSDEKKAVIEQICALQMVMLEDFGKRYPKLANNTRSFHTYDDNFNNTSYETYLRGEISTYSDKMLQLYGGFVVGCAQNGINIAEETIRNTARFYGYDDLESFEAV